MPVIFCMLPRGASSVTNLLVIPHVRSSRYFKISRGRHAETHKHNPTKSGGQRPTDWSFVIPCQDVRLKK